MSRAILNVEVGHIDWNSDEAPASLAESIRISGELVSGQGLTRDDYCMSILVDDKVLEIASRTNWLDNQIQKHPALFEGIDYVVFESDLGAFGEKFLSLVNPKYQGAIRREMDRYIKKHGVIACSHDIALWHSYRLGLLGEDASIVHVMSADGPTKAAPFFAQQCLSVLGDENKEPENRAEGILKRLTDRTILDRIEVVYYAV